MFDFLRPKYGSSICRFELEDNKVVFGGGDLMLKYFDFAETFRKSVELSCDFAPCDEPRVSVTASSRYKWVACIHNDIPCIGKGHDVVVYSCFCIDCLEVFQMFCNLAVVQRNHRVYHALPILAEGDRDAGFRCELASIVLESRRVDVWLVLARVVVHY